MSFLALPRELRSMVYAHFVVLAVPSSDNKGLLFSCRQIRAEFSHECTLVLKKYQESLRIPGVCVFIPQAHDFRGRSNLHLSLSTKVFTDYSILRIEPPSSSHEEFFRRVFRAYFDIIVIKFHVEDEEMFCLDHIRWICRNILRRLKYRAETAHARCIIIERPHGAIHGDLDVIAGFLGSSSRRVNCPANIWLVHRACEEKLVVKRHEANEPITSCDKVRV
jgi:hypothetical protein